MVDEDTTVRLLLDIYETETGGPGDPDMPLLEALSSLELIKFLLAVEAAIPDIDLGELDEVCIASPRAIAKSLARRPR